MNKIVEQRKNSKRDEQVRPRFRTGLRIPFVLVASIGVFFVLAFVVACAKRPWSDEGWFANAAFNLAYHGFMGTTVLENPNLPRIHQHTYWILPLYLVGLAGWFKAIGFGLVKMRMFSAVFGAVAVASWYLTAQRLLRDNVVAALAAILLGTDYLFINIGTLGRPDMMCAGWGSLAIATYLVLRERSVPQAFLWANIPLACAFFTHPNAILFGAIFLLLIIALDGRFVLRFRTLLFGAIPYLAGAFFWSFYIRKDPSAFVAQLSGNADRQERFGNFVHPWHAIKAEVFERYLTAYGLGPHSAGHTGPIALKAFVLVCYVAAIILCLTVPDIRKRPGVKLILVMTALVFLIQCFFNQKLSWYLVDIIPLYTLLLAIAFANLWRRGRMWQVGAAAVFLALLGIQIGGSLYLAKTNIYKTRYRPLLAFLNQLPPEERIDGSAAILFGLEHPDRLRDDVSLGYYDHREPRYIVMDPIYHEALEGLGRNDPPAYRWAQAQLKAAHQVYDNGEFRVYATQ